MHPRASQYTIMEMANKGIFMSKVGSVQCQLSNMNESGIIIILWMNEQPSAFFFLNVRVTNDHDGNSNKESLSSKSLRSFSFSISFYFIIIQKNIM